MTADLCEHVAGFRRWFDGLDHAYARGGAPPPSRLVFPDDGGAIDDRLFALETGAQLGLSASRPSTRCSAPWGSRPTSSPGTATESTRR
ncbi:MAG: hypothetical protein R2712_28385 [Vicinamibacterales bacterium]